jgi:hypothetical protein
MFIPLSPEVPFIVMLLFANRLPFALEPEAIPMFPVVTVGRLSMLFVNVLLLTCRPAAPVIEIPMFPELPKTVMLLSLTVLLLVFELRRIPLLLADELLAIMVMLFAMNTLLSPFPPAAPNSEIP